MKHDSECELIDTFVKRWKDGSLTNDDPIVRKVIDLAPKIASRWGWPDRAEEVAQDTFLKLALGKYRGEGSLDGYINHIIVNLVRHLWRRERRNRRIEMPVDFEDKRHFASEIEARLSDRTKRLLARVPEGNRWFIEAIVDADGYLSQRDAAALGNVKRNQVEKLRKELRLIWTEMEAEREQGTREETDVESQQADQAKARTAGD